MILPRLLPTLMPTSTLKVQRWTSRRCDRAVSTLNTPASRAGPDRRARSAVARCTEWFSTGHQRCRLLGRAGRRHGGRRVRRYGALRASGRSTSWTVRRRPVRSRPDGRPRDLPPARTPLRPSPASLTCVPHPLVLIALASAAIGAALGGIGGVACRRWEINAAKPRNVPLAPRSTAPSDQRSCGQLPSQQWRGGHGCQSRSGGQHARIGRPFPRVAWASRTRINLIRQTVRIVRAGSADLARAVTGLPPDSPALTCLACDPRTGGAQELSRGLVAGRRARRRCACGGHTMTTESTAWAWAIWL
jgi:hypothetical protein